MCCANILPDEAAQYASELLEGISKWFMCRQGYSANQQDDKPDCVGSEYSGMETRPAAAASLATEGQPLPAGAWATRGLVDLPPEHANCTSPCGYFAPPEYWVRTSEDGVGGHYRCPICATLYQTLDAQGALCSGKQTPHR